MAQSGCGDFRLGLGVYVLGRLPPPESDALRAHLTDCPACRAELAALRPAADALSRVFPEPVFPPDDAAAHSSPPPVAAARVGRAGTRRGAGRGPRTGASPRGALIAACAARRRTR
ncbi:MULTISPECIES: anti-sigma factor family protein [Actinomadura]|uniref:anti-sigma factor family protein n=1 Tax=Actinomadura rubrobrunea TaxID=115335 RepID=UPI000A029EA5